MTHPTFFFSFFFPLLPFKEFSDVIAESLAAQGAKEIDIFWQLFVENVRMQHYSFSCMECSLLDSIGSLYMPRPTADG